jgi:hypothetical protein
VIARGRDRSGSEERGAAPIAERQEQREGVQPRPMQVAEGGILQPLIGSARARLGRAVGWQHHLLCRVRSDAVRCGVYRNDPARPETPNWRGT